MISKIQSRLGLVFITVLTVILFVFLLPKFDVKIGENVYEWPGLDFNLVSIRSSLANFQFGRDLYPHSQVQLISNYQNVPAMEQESAFVRDAELINRRLDQAGIRDARVIVQKQATDYKLVVDFPGNYQQDAASSLAKIASTYGVIQFWVDAGAEGTPNENIVSMLMPQILPDYKPTIGSLSIADIASIGVESRSDLNAGGNALPTTVWKLRFRDEAIDRINKDITLASNASPALLAIDNEPVFVLRPINTNPTTGATTDVLAIPILLNDNTELKLMSTYLTVQGNIVGSFSVLDTLTRTSGYAPIGMTIVALGFVGVALLMAVSIFTKHGLRTGTAQVWALALTLLVFVSLLKLGAAPLSLTLVISVAVYMVISKLIVAQVFASAQPEVLMRHLRNLGICLLLLAWVATSSGYLIGNIQDFAVLLGVFGASLIVMNGLLYKLILPTE